MLSQQDQEMWRNVPDPSFAGGSHFCGSRAWERDYPVPRSQAHPGLQNELVSTTGACHLWPSTSCTGICFTITMLQYYICLGIVLTVILVLGLGLGFGIILYFVIGT